MQAIPFTVNDVGAASFDVQVAWKPNDALPPADTEPLYGMLVTVTAAPDCAVVAFQVLVIFWSPGKVHATFQLDHGVDPVLSTVTFALKPPPHSLDFAYTT